MSARSSKAQSKAEVAASTIGETQESLAGNEADLQAATEVRQKESVDFRSAENELLDVNSALERAMCLGAGEGRPWTPQGGSGHDGRLDDRPRGCCNADQPSAEPGLRVASSGSCGDALAAGWGGQIFLFDYLFALGGACLAPWVVANSSCTGTWLSPGKHLRCSRVKEKGVSLYLALYLVTWCGAIFYLFSRFIFTGPIRVFLLGTIRVFHSGRGGTKFIVLGRHLVWGDLLPVLA
eukprot:s3585_g7.t1